MPTRRNTNHLRRFHIRILFSCKGIMWMLSLGWKQKREICQSIWSRNSFWGNSFINRWQKNCNNSNKKLQLSRCFEPRTLWRTLPYLPWHQTPTYCWLRCVLGSIQSLAKVHAKKRHILLRSELWHSWVSQLLTYGLRLLGKRRYCEVWTTVW